MVSVGLLEEGMWIVVDGRDHVTMPDLVRDYQIIEHTIHNVTVSNPTDDKTYLIFREEADCIISSDIKCPDHGRKLYHDGKTEWYCPWC